MSCFAFNMKELGALIGLGIRVELASDSPIFRRPYRYSDMERDLIQSWTLDLLEAGLVELSHGEYMAITQIGGCVETTVLSINRLSLISMPCLHLKRSLMLCDM